jgi:D-hydroxyproline dehydrogenase subunit beta
MVGAAVAAYLAATGRRVCVIDRSGPLGGTTAAGEGNILVSDKLPGPELALALRSLALWRDFAATADFEFETKGGVVVAHNADQLAALSAQARRQRAAGVETTELDQTTLRTAEPQIALDLPGGAFYPQDCQVQPMLAAMAYLARSGVPGVVHADALGLDPGTGRLVTDQGWIATPVVVNAAGPWSGEVARRLGSALPVRPRRGHILVTEPLPPVINHKVYECDYIGAVVSDSDALACSAVVEATASGTILIGSSRDYGGALPDGSGRDHSTVPPGGSGHALPGHSGRDYSTVPPGGSSHALPGHSGRDYSTVPPGGSSHALPGHSGRDYSTVPPGGSSHALPGHSGRDYSTVPPGGSSYGHADDLPSRPGAPDRAPPPEVRVLAEIARRAISLFPLLRQARAIRAYTGYRPACADHLPVIGPDPSVPGLYHATGHEGAGICLAPATAELLTALIDAAPTRVDPAPFSPARFSGGHHAR